MIFIVFLRALAACLITNSHYTGVYPIEFLANGGLIGDVLFFAVSGFCLFDVKKTFFGWYGKRLKRIYPPVIIITIVYLLIGCYTVGEQYNLMYWLVYPTAYHFVSSILLLYLVFYWVGKYDLFRKRIPLLMVITAGIYFAIYLLFYDKTYYHIDTVREPMILFLYFESMLLGAWFKQSKEMFCNKFKWRYVIEVTVLLILYCVAKVLFSKNQTYSYFQCVNQLIIFALLYCVFRLFYSLDEKLEHLPLWIKNVVAFLAKITLEIYVVQNVIISALKPYFVFPFNWIIITASIIFAAFVLHFACALLLKGSEYLVNLCKAKWTRKGDKQNETSSHGL